MRRILLFISLLLMATLMMDGCAVTKKLSAADILSKTTLEFDNLSLDSASLNKNLFPKSDDLKKSLLPNPHVIALVQDFARGILEKEIGKIHFTATLNAKNQSNDTLWIRGLMANHRRIFRLMEVNVVHIIGRMDVSLKAADEAFTLDFDQDRKISQEEKQALADKARTSVLDNIVSDWVGAISF